MSRRGWTFAETPFSAIPQIQLEPESAEVRPLLQKRLVRVVLGSERNWIAVNAVQQSNLNKRKEEKNMTTIYLRKSIDRSPLRLGFLLIPLVLACFAFSPQARAVCQEGCLTNNNTVLGDDALLSLTTGVTNTAIGSNALFNNTEGSANTAIGFVALFSDTTGGSNTAIGTGALYSNTTGSFNIATGGSNALWQHIGQLQRSQR